MAKQLYQAIRKCCWYPTPPHKGQPTSPLHYYDPESDEVPLGRDIPLSMEWLDPDDPWVANSGILDHFKLPEELEPDMIETPLQYMARCKTGVKAPVDADMVAKIAKERPDEPAKDGKPLMDATKLDLEKKREGKPK